MSGKGYSYWHCQELTTLMDQIGLWRTEKGFNTSPSNIGEKLMLVVTELAEAMEDARVPGADLQSSRVDVDGKPIGFASEIADAFIRLLDISDACGIDIAREIALKMQYNETRPHKHGKTC